PMAASRCGVIGSSLWDRRQHSSSLSAHGTVFPRRLFWYRPPGVAILASSSDLRFCTARSGQQTWGWPKTSEYRRAIPPEISRLQWGTRSWLGSRCPSPRQWPHDSIPKRLTAQEVERRLALSAG